MMTETLEVLCSETQRDAAGRTVAGEEQWRVRSDTAGAGRTMAGEE
jgi:hypothetical protein